MYDYGLFQFESKQDLFDRAIRFWNPDKTKFWQKAGVERIILSRELSLDEVAMIRQECPDMELEVFVHGALCIAYSGRCLLSGYFNRRDPNQGTCTNACRWNYATHDATDETDSGEVRPIKMEGNFNFAAEQEQAEQAFSACGDGAPMNRAILTRASS